MALTVCFRSNIEKNELVKISKTKRISENTRLTSAVAMRDIIDVQVPGVKQ